jgi:AcrR family transcriptional regulator
MVQKSEGKRRGRPRAYDPDKALRRAMETFWERGYAATSLDDLSAAMGMNRPSLYAAFGDKRALYLKALESYIAASRAGLDVALSVERPLREALRRVYASALSVYLAGANAARGCLLIGTAATESVSDPEVRALMANSVRSLDEAFEARIRFAQERGEVPKIADPAALAKLASAVLHTLAIRSRAGAPRAALEATAEAGVDLICGAPDQSISGT